MNPKKFLAAATLVLVLPAAAHAVDLRARYEVDATALKAAIAGTMLSFQVYGDSACSGPLLGSMSANVESLGSIEVLKRFAPKGSAKPPKTARLEPVITGLPGAFQYYLKVAGTGITAVGGDCQQQFATPPSAVAGSIPAGVTTISGPYLTLASLTTEFPSAGTALVQFETELSAYATDQYLTCFLLDNSLFVQSFELDPGDFDAPIPWYDQRQSHQLAVAATAGSHLWEVQCSLATGPAVDSFGARINVAWSAAGL